MPATMNEIVTAGPARSLATVPTNTYTPAPIVEPIPDKPSQFHKPCHHLLVPHSNPFHEPNGFILPESQRRQYRTNPTSWYERCYEESYIWLKPILERPNKFHKIWYLISMPFMKQMISFFQSLRRKYRTNPTCGIKGALKKGMASHV